MASRLFSERIAEKCKTNPAYRAILDMSKRDLMDMHYQDWPLPVALFELQIFECLSKDYKEPTP